MKWRTIYRILTIFLLCVTQFFSVFAQNELYFGTQFESMAHALKFWDGKYYIAGSTRTDLKNAKDYYVLILNPDGTVEKEIIYGFLRHDTGSGIWVDDQGIFVVGSAYDWGFPNVDMHLFKIENDGETDWEQFYGTQYQDMGFDISRTSDGGFAMTGYSNTQFDGGAVYLVKTDSRGNLQWEKFFGPKYVDYGFAIVENSTEELILAGTENGFHNPTQTDFMTHDADILVIKTDNNGNQLWYKKYGGRSHDWAKDIITAPDGGYYVSGSTQSFGAGSFDVFLMKIDEDGMQEWFKTYGGSEFDYGEKLTLGADGNIYISGTTASFSDNLKPQHLILKTDPDGNLIWQKTLGGPESSYSSGLAATPDSGVVFTGWTKNGPADFTNIVLYKLTKDGETELISSTSPEMDKLISVSVFPNPANQEFKVIVNDTANRVFSFTLTDLTGRIVYRTKLETGTNHIENSGIADGVYVYTITTDGKKLQSGRIVISSNK